MIDEHTEDFTGFARFSDDRAYRYRLSRVLTDRPLEARSCASKRVVFVMLNPSTADAFKLDPTVRRCVAFGKRWGADLLEVVNLFAYRSPDPGHLWERYENREPIGDDIENDRAILDAVAWPDVRVIAAWGNHGRLGRRAERVRELLRERHVELSHLGTTGNGSPLHPLARGKAFIPISREPVVWPC